MAEQLEEAVALGMRESRPLKRCVYTDKNRIYDKNSFNS